MKLKRMLSACFAAAMLVCSTVMPQSAAATEHYVVTKPYCYGDADQDNNVDIGDAVLLARFLAEDIDVSLSENGKICADVNFSGMPDHEDVKMILEFIALLRPTLAPYSVTGKRSVSLMEGVSAEKIKGKQADDAFVSSQYRLAAELLKENVQEAEGQNMMISPLSVSLALAMTANGAAGDTRAEMESVLGDSISIEDLNAYYYDYASKLTDEEDASLKKANAIWVLDDENMIQVPEAFLKTNASYYSADMFKAPFDNTTLTDVNEWTNEKTAGMIPELLTEFPPNIVMLLVNALAFEAKWTVPYAENKVSDADFYPDGTDAVTVSIMHGEEKMYLCDDNATGFIKTYANGDYSFAAILPDEDITLSDYIAQLDGKSLQKILNSRTEETVITGLPKFSFSYSIKMNDMLCKMGMPKAFASNADFTGLNSLGDTFIGLVLHKTFIDLNENGTKAGAVTAVAMERNGISFDAKEVILNRPFLFAILDEHTGLPVFIGTVTKPSVKE